MISKILNFLSDEELLKKIEKIAKVIGLAVIIFNGIASIVGSIKETIDSIVEWFSNKDLEEAENEA